MPAQPHALREVVADLLSGRARQDEEPSASYVLVDDVDSHYERAKAAGATIVEELNDLPFGHRRYTCDDPQGHQWSFATPIAVDGGEAKAETS